jgi:hypothetical protein
MCPSSRGHITETKTVGWTGSVRLVDEDADTYYVLVSGTPDLKPGEARCVRVSKASTYAISFLATPVGPLADRAPPASLDTAPER